MKAELWRALKFSSCHVFGLMGMGQCALFRNVRYGSAGRKWLICAQIPEGLVRFGYVAHWKSCRGIKCTVLRMLLEHLNVCWGICVHRECCRMLEMALQCFRSMSPPLPLHNIWVRHGIGWMAPATHEYLQGL